MLKFTPHFVLILAAFVFSACPYNANVPLSTPDTMSFDPRILGHWKSPYLTAEINGLRISKSSDGQLIATEFSMEKGKIKYDKDSLIFTPTKIDDVFFLDQKSDTANLWAAHPYFFSLNGNVLSTYSLNDTIIGKNHKFASTAQYREYVAKNIDKRRFLENPDIMMRVSEGELNGNYIDLMVTDTVVRHTQKIAYSVQVSESQYLYPEQPGAVRQKQIQKIERQIKRHTAPLRLDSLVVANDHGFELKQFYFTAKNPTNLEYQKNALRQVKNISINPIQVVHTECPADLSPILDKRLEAIITQMAKSESIAFTRVEPVVAQDPFEEHENALTEKASLPYMKINDYLMKNYNTIEDVNKFTLDGMNDKYWKVAIYRIWLR